MSRTIHDLLVWNKPLIDTCQYCSTSRANQALRSLTNAGFQTRGVSLQAFPSFPSLPPPCHFLALVSFLARPKPVFLCCENQTETLATQTKESTAPLLSIEWSHFRILSTDAEGRITLCSILNSHHGKVLLSSSRLNGCTLGFHPKDSNLRVTRDGYSNSRLSWSYVFIAAAFFFFFLALQKM